MGAGLDYLAELFTSDPAVIAANQAELARQAAAEQADRDAYAERRAFQAANACPRCMGAGRLAQFSHRKGGECFACAGSGVFVRYRNPA